MGRIKRATADSDEDYDDSRPSRKKTNTTKPSIEIVESRSLNDGDFCEISADQFKSKSPSSTTVKPRKDESADYPLLPIPKSGAQYDKAKKCFMDTINALPQPPKDPSSVGARAYTTLYQLAKYIYRNFEYQGNGFKTAREGRVKEKTKVEKLKKAKADLTNKHQEPNENDDQQFVSIQKPFKPASETMGTKEEDISGQAKMKYKDAQMAGPDHGADFGSPAEHALRMENEQLKDELQETKARLQQLEQEIEEEKTRAKDKARVQQELMSCFNRKMAATTGEMAD